MARTKKGIRVYQPLLERNLVMAQKKELALRFELSEESWLAEAAVQEFNAQMDQYESALHIERMPPGHLLVSFRNQLVQIPLLTPEWAVVLASDHCFTEHRSSVYGEALRRFKTIDPSATLEDVYPYLNRRELLPRGQVGGCKRMRMPTSGQLIDPSRVNASPLPQLLVGEIPVPLLVQKRMRTFLTAEANVGQSTAVAITQFLAARRENFCPRISTLKPGQVVWLSLSATKHKPPGLQFARRLVSPIVLTLFTEEEFHKTAHTLTSLNQIHMEQSARILVEAYLQDTLIPQVEMELLFLRSYSVMEELIRNYMNIHQVILPTPGTILDAGRAMTHKRMIVEESVSGLFTSEIARKTYHAPESVDAYLKVFQSVLILSLYEMPIPLMARVTGRGKALIEEYMVLVNQHFPNRNEIKRYLMEQGLEIV
jgi:hypothetical protein